MGFKITSLKAFIAVDPEDGDEGLIGLPLPGSSALSMPAIAADDTRAKELYPLVKKYCKDFDIEFKVIKLSERSDITHEFE